MKIKNEISAGGIVYKNVPGFKSQTTRLWLIGQHSAHKGWVFLKGLIGDKINTESMEQAALREVEEEGGIKARIVNNHPVKVQYIYKLNNNSIKKTVYYFVMEYVSGDPKDHDWEMNDVKFMKDIDIKKTLTYESDKEAFEKVLKYANTI